MAIVDRCRRDRRRRRHGERGAVAIELAIVAPMLIVITLGLVEIGLAWRDQIAVTNASRQGARVASALADDTRADREALLNLVSALDPEDADRIVQVIFWEANGSNEPPTACLTASRNNASARCNRFDATDIDDLDDLSHWGCGPGDHDTTWCASTRNNDFVTADQIGVYVELDRPWITGFLGDSGITITATTVMRLEPEPT